MRHKTRTGFYKIKRITKLCCQSKGEKTMVNKKFPVKDGLKRAFQTTCGLSLLLAAYIFSGCASWPTEGPSGTLTITGIPAEYEGKLALANLLASNKEVARGVATAITNGELKLPLYEKKSGYFGSDTFNIRLKIEDPGEAPINNQFGEAGTDAIFESVKFEDGVKEVKWDDQVTPGFITLTNIPPEFTGQTGGRALVYIGNPDYELKVTGPGSAQGTEATCSVAFPLPTSSAPRDIATGKFIASEYGKYRPFPQSGTRDVIVQLSTFANPNNPATISYSFFRFKTARIDGYRIHLDLSEGVKEK
jgi:hypothetical protein